MIFIKRHIPKFLIAFFMLLIAFISLANTNTYAATSNIDTNAYNVSWQKKANCKFWLYRNEVLFGFVDKTFCYLRITDNDGNLINNMTRLEARYVIDGRDYKVQGDFKEFKAMNLSKNGTLNDFDSYSKKINNGLKSHKECAQEFDDYEECNYVWSWNYVVSEFIYLYVWYIDPTTGDEVAASFLEDGAHPLYDANGTLLGIYNSDNELMENYTLNSNGVPSLLKSNGVYEPMIKPNDQMVDEVENKGSAFPSILGLGSNNGDNDILSIFMSIMSMILIIIVVLFIGFILFKILSLFTNSKNK